MKWKSKKSFILKDFKYKTKEAAMNKTQMYSAIKRNNISWQAHLNKDSLTL